MHIPIDFNLRKSGDVLLANMSTSISFYTASPPPPTTIYFMSILSSIMLLVLQLFQNLWSNGMPITVNNIGISGHQQSARRFQEITHGATEILPFHDTKKERFISELFHNNGSCFMWSSNVLMLDAWIPFNCTYRL